MASAFELATQELYALHPDQFAAARDEQAKQAKAGGDAALARELAKLRRPTLSAFLVNLLWRDQRPVLEQLLQVAEGLTQAQAQASGSALRELMAVRRELEAALLRRSRALAAEAGVTVSAAMEREVQDTLAAALANAEVAAELRTGRMVKPASYSGFGSLVEPGGVVIDLPAVRARAAAAKPAAPAAKAAAVADAEQARAAWRAEQERERESAEQKALARRKVAMARANLEAAADVLAAQNRADRAAAEHAEELTGQVERLRERLAKLETELVEARNAASAAEARRLEAAAAHEVAARALAEAEANAAD